jgi:hypothetical protein
MKRFKTPGILALVIALSVAQLADADSPIRSTLRGGTGQATAVTFNSLSPVTISGDLIVGNGSNSNTRLPGPVSTAANFLSGTGNGSVNTTVAWSSIGVSDLSDGSAVAKTNVANTFTKQQTFPAGTATTAPLLLNPSGGVLLSTPLPGAVEQDATNLYWTDGAGARRTVYPQAGGGGSLNYVQKTQASFSTSNTSFTSMGLAGTITTTGGPVRMTLCTSGAASTNLGYGVMEVFFNGQGENPTEVDSITAGYGGAMISQYVFTQGYGTYSFDGYLHASLGSTFNCNQVTLIVEELH